jgi:hypothetical protein
MQNYTIYRGVHSCSGGNTGWLAHATIKASDMAEAVAIAKKELGDSLHKVIKVN